MNVVRDLSIEPKKAMIIGVPLMAALLMVIVLPYRLIWASNPARAALHASPWWVLILVLIVGICIHEGLHGAVWYLSSPAPRPKIRFGINWKVMMPYAHSIDPMPARSYIVGALTPAILMGALPGVWAICQGNAVIAGWAALFLVAAAGDLIVVGTLRGVPTSALVKDHSSRVGCQVVST